VPLSVRSLCHCGRAPRRSPYVHAISPEHQRIYLLTDDVSRPAVLSDRATDDANSAPPRADAALLRRIWRLHFWIGLFCAPALVVLACSGLIILYSQPLDSWLNRDLLVVTPGSQTVPLDDQIAAAQRRVGPDHDLDAVIPPAAADRATRVDFLPPGATGFPESENNLTQVFVDPYTGEVLGQRSELSGLVGWANQVHRLFGNDGPQLRLPSLGHLLDPDAYPEATIPVGIGNLWMELTAVWILVLLATGIYLWWPRAVEAAKPLLTVRWSRGGRVRWRDLHALVGVFIAVVVAGYVLSGLPWSRYWGENWRAFTTIVTPSAEVSTASIPESIPESTPATMGDYDRLGRRVAWADVDDPVYASQPTGLPRRLSFDDVDRVAKAERMLPGYAIIPPADDVEDGRPVYGSYAVVNAWPQRLSEQRTLYVDQFSGRTVAEATAAQDGALARATSFGVDMHMGNQFGWVTRLLATLVCVGVLTSVVTAALMLVNRRRANGTALPRRTGADGRLGGRAAAVLIVPAVVLGVLFPVFGLSLLIVLAVEAGWSRRRRTGGTDTAPPTPSSVTVDSSINP